MLLSLLRLNQDGINKKEKKENLKCVYDLIKILWKNILVCWVHCFFSSSIYKEQTDVDKLRRGAGLLATERGENNFRCLIHMKRKKVKKKKRQKLNFFSVVLRTS